MDPRYQPAGMTAIEMDSRHCHPDERGISLNPGAFLPEHRSFAVGS